MVAKTVKQYPQGYRLAAAWEGAERVPVSKLVPETQAKVIWTHLLTILVNNNWY